MCIENTTIHDKKLFLGLTALSSTELCNYTVERCIRKLLVAPDKYKEALDDHKRKCIMNELAELTKFMFDIRLALHDIYDLAGIDSGFRNIVPIHYMERCMYTGAADKLDGEGGLYELAEKALGQETMRYSISDLYTRSRSRIPLDGDLSFELTTADVESDVLIAETLNLIMQNSFDPGKTPLRGFRERRLDLIETYKRFMKRYA